MIIIGLVLFLEAPLAAQSDHIVLDSEIKVFPIHSRQLGFKNDLVLVFINVNGWVPGAAADTFVAEGRCQITGKQTIHFFLQRAQIAKRIVAQNTHFEIPPKDEKSNSCLPTASRALSSRLSNAAY